MDERVLALTTWDPDGGGPLAAQLVATGGFTTAGGQPVNSIARWDGAQWQPFGTGLNGWGFALTTWDPDGAGPLPAQLVVGGGFTTAGGQPANNIARWDGTQWLPFGTGMNSTVYSLTTWDPDGAGPLAPQLAAGGAFFIAGGVFAIYIAGWDGAQWQDIGGGMDNFVYALTTWDPDGAGPLAPQLAAGGNFSIASQGFVNNIARWDGAQWLPFGTGMNDWVYALTTWDPDGAGPLAPQLAAGGIFTAADGQPANYIASWDGTQWQPFGSGMNNWVFALTTWDPDGAGPLEAQLVAGGGFTTAGGQTVNNIARWDGMQWQPFGTGIAGGVLTLATWDPDGAGPLAPQLAAGGEISNAKGTSGFVEIWDECLQTPVCCPGNATKDAGGVVNFGDITAVLTNFNAVGDPFAQLGDADCSGTVNFSDITSVLTNFNALCP